MNQTEEKVEIPEALKQSQSIPREGAVVFEIRWQKVKPTSISVHFKIDENAKIKTIGSVRTWTKEDSNYYCNKEETAVKSCDWNKVCEFSIGISS